MTVLESAPDMATFHQAMDQLIAMPQAMAGMFGGR
jgi:hypothetical protein